MARYAPSLLVVSGLAELGRNYEASAKIERHVRKMRKMTMQLTAFIRRFKGWVDGLIGERDLQGSLDREQTAYWFKEQARWFLEPVASC